MGLKAEKAETGQALHLYRPGKATQLQHVGSDLRFGEPLITGLRSPGILRLPLLKSSRHEMWPSRGILPTQYGHSDNLELDEKLLGLWDHIW